MAVSVYEGVRMRIKLGGDDQSGRRRSTGGVQASTCYVEIFKPTTSDRFDKMEVPHSGHESMNLQILVLVGSSIVVRCMDKIRN